MRTALLRFTSLCLLVLALGFAGTGQAAALTADDIDRFIESLPDAIELGEEFEAQGLGEALMAETLVDESGAFTPYTSGLTVLKTESASAYSRVEELAAKHDFRSAEDWAAVGDRVVLAYMAVRMPPEAFEMMAQITPDMRANLPPQMQEQMANAMAMSKAIKAVPEADTAMIMPFADRLDEVLSNTIAPNAGMGN